MELPKFSPTHSFRFISSTTGEVETTKAIPKGLPFFVGAIATWSNKGGNWVFSFRDFGWRTKAPTLTMNSKGGSNLVWRFCLAELYTFTFRILFRWHFGLVNSTLFTPKKKQPQLKPHWKSVHRGQFTVQMFLKALRLLELNDGTGAND